MHIHYEKSYFKGNKKLREKHSGTFIKLLRRGERSLEH